MSHKKIIFITILSIAILICSYFVLANYGFFSGGTNAPSVSADTMTRGLVGYWEFEEGTGQTAYDASDNSNNGQLGSTTSSDDNDPVWSAGKNGGGMEFDGVDDYVDCGSDASLDITDAITIEAWVKFAVPYTVKSHVILDKTYLWASSNYDGYGLAIDGNGSLRFEYGNGVAKDNILKDLNWITGQWYHIVVTYDNVDTTKMYRDSVLVHTDTNGIGAIDPSDKSLRISRRYGATYLYWDGSIDSVRIYNRVLSADEARYHYNRGGPVGYWNFDEGSGTTAFDGTGNNNDGTLKSSALDFDGDNDYVEVADDDSLDFGTSDFTVETWINADTQTELYSCIIEKANDVDWTALSSKLGFWFGERTPNSLYFVLGDGTETASPGPSTVILGAFENEGWIHLAVTVDDAGDASPRIKGYRNGALVDDEARTLTGSITNAEKLYVGIWESYNRDFNGYIDEVRVYNKALHATTIANHYNNDFTSYEKDSDGNDLVAGDLVMLQHLEEGMACDANGEVDCLTDDSSVGANDGTLYSFDNLTAYDNGVDGWITDVKKPGWRWVNGKYKTAGEFNGVDDYVDMVDNSNWDNISVEGTISVWFKTDTLPGDNVYPHIVSRRDLATNIWELVIDEKDAEDNNELKFDVTGGTLPDLIDTVALATDTWYHAVVTWNSTSGSLYKNGNLVASNAGGTVGTGDIGLAIGNRIGGGKAFNGSIDEVRIYNYIRTADEIRLDYNAGVATHLGPSGKTCSEDPAGCMDYGLVGSWGMDEGAGTMAYDSSDEGNDGTLTNGPKWTTDSPPFQGGAGGGSLKFDGVDDYVNITSTIIDKDNGAFSLWFKSSADFSANYGTRGNLLGKDSKYISYLGIIGDGTIPYELQGETDTNSDYFVSETTGTVPVGVWNHVVSSFDGGTVTIYLNGVELGTFIADDDLTINRIGGGNSETLFNGSIDSVRTYNRALSADEARYHYNRGGPVGYWNFDEGSGLTAFDSTGNNNDGTLKSSALEFDGVNDYVGVTDNIAIGQNSFTFEAWAKTSRSSADQSVIDTSSAVSGWRGNLKFPNSSTRNALFNVTAVGDFGNIYRYVDPYDDSSNTTDGEWHHIVGVCDRTQHIPPDVYLDGILANGSSSGYCDSLTPDITFTSLEIGEIFNGFIDEVRIYDTALSAAEIARHYNNDFSQDPTGNLVLLQHFEEGMVCDANGEAGCLTDDSSETNNGTLYNFDNLTTYDNGTDGWISEVKKPEWRWVNGRYKTAGEFNGWDDCVDVGTISLADDTPWSVSMWVKSEDLAKFMLYGNQFIAGSYTRFFYSTSLSQFRVYNDVNSYADWAVSPTVNEWNHIVVVCDGLNSNNLELFISAVSQGKDTLAISAQVIKMIGGVGSTLFFNGSIDDVRIYDYARTADEIRLDYQAGMATHLGPSGKDCDDDPAGCMDYGLVGSWGMDEGAGLTAYDSSDNSNDGTLTNGPVWTEGACLAGASCGGGLKFDGVDDYISVPDDGSLDITEEITIEAWTKGVKPGAGNPAARIAVKGLDATSERDYGFYITSTSQIGFDYFGTGASYQSYKESGGEFDDDVWQHLTVVFTFSTGSSMQIYKDGMLLPGSWTTGDGNVAAVATNRILAIGRRGETDGGYFNGSIDSVRIYNRALSAEEVRYHYNKGGPVGYWKFDEGSGQTAFDESFNNNDGTLGATSGVEASDPTWVEGKYGGALSFDGGDYVALGTQTIYNAETVSFWFNSKGTNIDVRMFDGNYVGIYANNVVTGASSDTLSAFVHDGTAFRVVEWPWSNISQDVWYYVALTYNTDGNVKLYVDGSLKDTNTNYDGTVGSTSVEHAIGAHRAGNEDWFTGYIDEVRVYNYARTVEQIQTDYNAGVATHFR